jgi:hypothetical protein
MNTKIANSLMREEAGVAAKLLYSVKQSLAGLNKNLAVSYLLVPSHTHTPTVHSLLTITGWRKTGARA